MALENPYCTVAELRAYIRNYNTTLLKTDVTDTLTEVLERSINSASRFIDGWMNRDYYFHDHSVNPIKLYFNSAGVDKKDKQIALPFYPIVALTSITYDSTTYADGVDYYEEDGVIHFFGSFPFPYGSCRGNNLSDWVSGYYKTPIEILGTFGYFQAASTDVPTGIPSEINHACIVASAAMSGNYQREVVGVGSSEQIYSTDIENIFYKILGKRRQGLIA